MNTTRPDLSNINLQGLHCNLDLIPQVSGDNLIPIPACVLFSSIPNTRPEISLVHQLAVTSFRTHFHWDMCQCNIHTDWDQIYLQVDHYLTVAITRQYYDYHLLDVLGWYMA
jgi:hypothetical protein